MLSDIFHSNDFMFCTVSHNSVRVVLCIAYVVARFFVMDVQKGDLNKCMYLCMSLKKCGFGNLAMVKR